MSFVLSVLLSIGEAVEQRLLVMFALVRLPGLCAARGANTWVRPYIFWAWELVIVGWLWIHDAGM